MAFKNYDSSGNVLSRSLTDLPVGTIVSTALSAAPSGWLICDGTAVSRTSYPELFGALGTGYGAGNGTTTFNVPNSDGQMILAISTAQRIGVAMPPQFVTTLPSSPIDGTEVYYQSTTAGTGGGATNSMADVGAVWHLRYRAASSSVYKWEFVGGADLNHYIATENTKGVGTGMGALATAGPIVVAPEKGDYIITLSCYFRNGGSDGYGWFSYKIGATAADTADGAFGEAAGTGNSPSINLTKVAPKTLTGTDAAARTLTANYQAGGSTSSGVWSARFMVITPIRVGA
jgi:microcystin-dependent protein